MVVGRQSSVLGLVFGFCGPDWVQVVGLIWQDATFTLHTLTHTYTHTGVWSRADNMACRQYRHVGPAGPEELLSSVVDWEVPCVAVGIESDDYSVDGVCLGCGWWLLCVMLSGCLTSESGCDEYAM